MPRSVEVVYAHTEQDARDMALRRGRDAHRGIVAVDEVIELEPHRTGLRPFVVWLSVTAP
jgi:Mg-chelatase subunit ChlI